MPRTLIAAIALLATLLVPRIAYAAPAVLPAITAVAGASSGGLAGLRVSFSNGATCWQPTPLTDVLGSAKPVAGPTTAYHDGRLWIFGYLTYTDAHGVAFACQ